MGERLGILGGTFDPVHRGHLAVALEVRERLGLDRVLLVPAALPPHRAHTEAPAADRLALVRAAVAGLDGLEASDLEVARGGVSYTLDTLRELSAALPQARLHLLLGADAARDFPSWREPEAIAALATLVVFNRAGDGGAALVALPLTTVVLDVDSPPISATAVRAELARGGDGQGALPASVLRLIRERGLYSRPATSSVS